MKKIISLILMFVLSVGFLMAQSNRLTYQAVVEDEQGNLVVDQDMNATVTIQFTGSTTTYNPEIYPETIHTSLNGMAMFYIFLDDIPADVDWKTAEIKVQFSPVAAGVTVPTAEFEKAAGVPYALQAGGDDALTTEMIADYYSRPTTTMEDMQAIFDALERNEWLSEDLMWAFVDTVIANRQVAKEILLHYLNTGTTDDVQALYNAFDGNDGVKAAVAQIVKQLIQTHREEVYAVLRDYALHLTSAEVNDIFDAFPNDVKQEIVARAANYVKDPAHKSTLIIPIFMDYVTNITVAEFDELVDALIDNTPVYNVMLNQFNAWMDEYFAHHFNGGSHVEDLVADVIEEGYYAQCTPNPVDLCQLKEDIESLAVCFETEDTEFSFEKLETGNIVHQIHYTGTTDPTTVTVTVTVIDHENNNNVVSYNTNVQGVATIDPNQNVINVTLNPDAYNYVPGYVIQVELSITVGCLETSVQAVGFYLED